MDSMADPNNNHEEKSYSLRPRTVMRKDEEETDQEDWRPRGRVKRRTKQKSLPLSKYRRKTANARERSRMREINDAFEALRRVLPLCKSRSDSPHEKTTKIMTLRMAMKYITTLDSVLRRADMDSDAESLVSDSLTASSPDLLDQLLGTSSFDEWPSPGPFTEPLRPSLTLQLDIENSYPKSPLRNASLTQLPSTPAQPVPLATTLLEPPVDLQDWRDLDCIPSSPVNLDDLFIT